MKTILSILEALMFNLLPPELAAQLLLIVKNTIPFVVLILLRAWLYGAIFFQKFSAVRYARLNRPSGYENLQLIWKYKQH